MDEALLQTKQSFNRMILIFPFNWNCIRKIKKSKNSNRPLEHTPETSTTCSFQEILSYGDFGGTRGMFQGSVGLCLETGNPNVDTKIYQASKPLSTCRWTESRNGHTECTLAEKRNHRTKIEKTTMFGILSTHVDQLSVLNRKKEWNNDYWTNRKQLFHFYKFWGEFDKFSHSHDDDDDDDDVDDDDDDDDVDWLTSTSSSININITMILHFPGWNPSAYRHAITNISGSTRGDRVFGRDRKYGDHHLWGYMGHKGPYWYMIFFINQWCQYFEIVFL